MKWYEKVSKWPELKKVLWTKIIAAIILGVMFLMAILSSAGAFGDPGDSGIVDEIAHIPAGYSYDKYLDYRMNPEHPPLAKALAGLPLALQKNIKGPKDDWSWNGINQWEAGWYMIYEAGNNPSQIFFWSRLPMMLLMILLGFLIFKWAWELFGRKTALFTLLLFAFYPDVIAHGRLVTTDIAAALGYVITIYFFDKALRYKNWKSILIAGIAFGLAQLLKFSAFVLFGVLLALAIVRAIIDRKEEGFWREMWKNFRVYFWTCVYSLILVWLVYIPFVFKTPAGIEHQLIETNLTADPKTLGLRNFLHLFENNPAARALGHYFLGVMLVFARVAGGNTTFALGHLSYKSIPWFFPFAWFVKTPLTIIFLFLSSAVLIISKKFFIKDKEKFWTLALFFAPWLSYWAITMQGSLNIGIRHLMPTVPFVLLLIAFSTREFLRSNKLQLWKYGILGALSIYLIVSTVSNYPCFISYFNEIVPKDQRYKYLVDSSLDWGQDLLRLQKYVNDNHIDSIKIDYFGGSVPSYYIPQAQAWHSSYGPTTGWLAVSATFYQSSKLVGKNEGKWSYDWLDSRKPDAIIGGSILVFHITPEELQSNPPVSPYPITKMEYPDNSDLERKVGI